MDLKELSETVQQQQQQGTSVLLTSPKKTTRSLDKTIESCKAQLGKEHNKIANVLHISPATKTQTLFYLQESMRSQMPCTAAWSTATRTSPTNLTPATVNTCPTMNRSLRALTPATASTRTPKRCRDFHPLRDKTKTLPPLPPEERQPGTRNPQISKPKRRRVVVWRKILRRRTSPHRRRQEKKQELQSRTWTWIRTPNGNW